MEERSKRLTHAEKGITFHGSTRHTTDADRTCYVNIPHVTYLVAVHRWKCRMCMVVANIRTLDIFSFQFSGRTRVQEMAKLTLSFSSSPISSLPSSVFPSSLLVLSHLFLSSPSPFFFALPLPSSLEVEPLYPARWSG